MEIILNCSQCRSILNNENSPVCVLCEEITNDDKTFYCKDIKCSVKNNSSVVRDLTQYVENSKGIYLFVCNRCFNVFEDIEDFNTKCFIINKAVEYILENEDFYLDEDNENIIKDAHFSKLMTQKISHNVKHDYEKEFDESFHSLD